MTKLLSPTQAQILTSAAQHPARLVEAPPNLPAAARNAIFQSMLRAGLPEEVSGDGGTVLRITETGLAAVAAAGAAEAGREAVVEAQQADEGQPDGRAAPPGREAAVEPGMPQSRISLRDTATALLVAWDAGLERPKPCPPRLRRSGQP
ncbi:hypothetical protein [Roseomonas sp. WA12]